MGDTVRQAGRALACYLPSSPQKLPVSFTALAFSLIALLTGISMAYAFAWSGWFGILCGLLLGVIPIVVPRINAKLDEMRCIERVSLACLVAISLILSVQTLSPLLNGVSGRILASVPLFLITAVLYIVYILANRKIKDRPVQTSGIAIDLFVMPPLVLILAMAVVLATYLLLLLEYIGLNYTAWQSITVRFLERGIIPPATLILFFWGLLLLANKWWLLSRERRLLDQGTASLWSAWQTFRRHKNADISAFLEIVWKKSTDFYTIPRYINWAIPILGFIGTVLGISLAADGIQRIISTQSSVSQLSSELGQAIAPLGIAFDTTLIALSLSVFLTLLQTVLQRWEDNFLIDYESRMRAGGNTEHQSKVN